MGTLDIILDGKCAVSPFSRFSVRYESRYQWPAHSAFRSRLQAGEQRECKVAANFFYDMTLPGKYTICAEWLLFEPMPPHQYELRSATIEVELLPLSSDFGTTTRRSQ